MYSSLTGWCMFPVKLKSFLKNTASGDAEYKPIIPIDVYRVDETKVTTDKYGKEYISLYQLYTAQDVSVDDVIVIGGITVTVKHVDKFYEAPVDVPNLCVIYL